MRNYDLEVPISSENKAITKDMERCISCGHCLNVCPPRVAAQQKIDIENNQEILCISCGQCANICPVEAIKERMAYQEVKNLLEQKEGKCIIFSIAPAVRVALGEEFGLDAGENIESFLPTALKKLGADYVFDITFGADLTIMEEATEFLKRIQTQEKIPQFSSCCPAWVKYVEVFYPEYIPHLSTTKSPISMQSTMIKTLFASKIKKLPEEIVHIVVAPCTAKKSEITRKELSVTSQDTNYVLTTRELAMLLKQSKIDIASLKPSSFDEPFPVGSGAGVIFGNSGGVSEAALRTAYFVLTGHEHELIKFEAVRGLQGVKEAAIDINGTIVNVAVASGMKSAKVLLDEIRAGKSKYAFIEIMGCPGGCINGGGQPYVKPMFLPNEDLDILETYREKRASVLYSEDERQQIRQSHNNPDIIKLYNDFLGHPLSEKAEELLHTSYEAHRERYPEEKE